MEKQTPSHRPLRPRYEQDTLFDLANEAEHLSHVYHYEMMNSPELRTDYVRYTERLISQIIDEKIDDVVFLDKSARPVAWLMLELWPLLGIGQDGEPIKRPEVRFANIDREQWEAVVGRSDDPNIGIDMRRVHPDTVDSLRGLFAHRNMDMHEYAHDEPTQFDGKNLLIVDEVKATGDTLVMADAMFSMAFPDANVRTTYWMPPETKSGRGGVRINADVPIWYDTQEIRGRGVADRDKVGSRHSVSMRQRRGATFLSTRFRAPDPLGDQLRVEISQLADEVADGIIPVVPDAQRSEKAFQAIMSTVNHLSVEELVAIKKAAIAEHRPFQEVCLEYKLERSRRNHPSQG